MPRSADEVQNSLQNLAKNVRLTLESTKPSTSSLAQRLVAAKHFSNELAPTNLSLLGKRAAAVPVQTHYLQLLNETGCQNKLVSLDDELVGAKV